ncbi:MAG: glycyl-tRNA synthetase alpha chain [Candidatus Deianiraeaceae bacterium]|jgi:glycyl-tRNA synthetase alpha chain
MYFQEIISTLKNFWELQGCAVLEGFDYNVGAGTLAPYTALYTLKHKQWCACYSQFCRRQTDGRYAQNPNRLSGYFQFQVIMKPFPHNAQKIYLQSLEAVGIKTEDNDITFLEDNWENPSIGASGLGSEIWINGMEVTQWTYMQQIGGLKLDVIPLEITYGLERLAMYVQGIDNIFDIQWSKNLTYGDIFKDKEYEMSFYYNEESNTENLFNLFQNAEKECNNLIHKMLPEPAYELALSCSNTLNLLDARSELSQIERASYILRVRNLVKKICEVQAKKCK